MEINQGELATELAARELKKLYEDDNNPDFPSGIMIKDITAECTEYTDEAQAIFNELYDEYNILITESSEDMIECESCNEEILESDLYCRNCGD